MSFQIGQRVICDIAGVPTSCRVTEVGASGYTYMASTGTREIRIGQRNIRRRRSHRMPKVKRDKSWWPAFGEAVVVVSIVVLCVLAIL